MTKVGWATIVFALFVPLDAYLYSKPQTITLVGFVCCFALLVGLTHAEVMIVRRNYGEWDLRL